MISLTILILLLSLLSYSLNTIFPDLLTELLWYLYTSVMPSRVSSQLSEQQTLRLEVLRLKKDLRATSAKDQFAKWAKLRRALDTKNGRLDVLNSEVSSSRLKFITQTRVLRFLLTTGLSAVIQLYYSSIPVFYIPRGWVPTYFELLLAFPWAPKGSVSIHTWSLACGAVVHFVVGMLLVDGVGGTVKRVAEKRRRSVMEEEKVKEERQKEGKGENQGSKEWGGKEGASGSVHAERR